MGPWWCCFYRGGAWTTGCDHALQRAVRLRPASTNNKTGRDKVEESCDYCAGTGFRLHCDECYETDELSDIEWSEEFEMDLCSECLEERKEAKEEESNG